MRTRITTFPAVDHLVIVLCGIVFCLGAVMTQAVSAAPLTHTISGTVKDNSAVAIAGALVTASGGFTGTATTDGTGVYTISGVPDGTTGITLTPTKTAYTFSPLTLTVT